MRLDGENAESWSRESGAGAAGGTGRLAGLLGPTHLVLVFPAPSNMTATSARRPARWRDPSPGRPTAPPAAHHSKHHQMGQEP
jgi:hypothetical protein